MAEVGPALNPIDVAEGPSEVLPKFDTDPERAERGNYTPVTTGGEPWIAQKVQGSGDQPVKLVGRSTGDFTDQGETGVYSGTWVWKDIVSPELRGPRMRMA